MTFKVVTMSDLHHQNAGPHILTYIRSEHSDLDELVLVGDRSIDPNFSTTDGRNLLRDAKIKAKAEGRDYREAEEEVWRSEYGPVLADQWLGILEPTRRMHRSFEAAVDAGEIPQAPDTGGNDEDKENRVLRAYEVLKGQGRESRGESLLEITAASHAFRSIEGVESRQEGRTLDLRIPYIEDKDDATLDRYLADVRQFTKGVQGIDYVIFMAHLTPDPALRKEKRNSEEPFFYQDAYAAVREELPDASLLQLVCHCHKLEKEGEPISYEFHGALQLLIGYGKKEKVQRVAVFDYESGERMYADMDLREPTLKVIREVEF